MSIFGPAGLDRNSGTRTDPHSAPGTGTHPGACATTPARRPSPSDGAPAAVGSAARASAGDQRGPYRARQRCETHRRPPSRRRRRQLGAPPVSSKCSPTYGPLRMAVNRAVGSPTQSPESATAAAPRHCSRARPRPAATDFHPDSGGRRLRCSHRLDSIAPRGRSRTSRGHIADRAVSQMSNLPTAEGFSA